MPSRRTFAFLVLSCLLAGPPPLSAAGVSPTAYPATVAGARFENADLRVTVAPAAVGTVQLLDRQGVVLATAALGATAGTDATSTGSSTAVFAGMLPRMLGGAPFFSLRLVVYGTPGAASSDWPFALSLACSSALCRPQIQPGVAPAGGTRWAKPELGEYFATAPPGQPVLAGALAAGLIGPALDFARVVGSESPAPLGVCRCSFVFEAESPAREVCGEEGLRVGVEAKNVSGERRIEAHRLHAVALELPLRCFVHGLASTYRTEVVSGGWRGPYEVLIPSLVPCTRPCAVGEPNYQLTAEGQVTAAVTHSDEDATADAAWELRATPRGGASFRAGDARLAIGSESVATGSQTVLWAGGASHLDVTVDLTAGVSLPGKSQTAAADAWVGLSIVVEAASLCGDVSRGSAGLRVSTARKGGDTPDFDPTQISILIGGGCQP